MSVRVCSGWFWRCAAGRRRAAPNRCASRSSRTFGSFGNAGEAVYRNLSAVERINARGGVRLPGGARPLEALRFDRREKNEERLRDAEVGARHLAFVMQGNVPRPRPCSLTRLDKHNEREAQQQSAVAQLLGRGPGAHEREVRLLALPPSTPTPTCGWPRSPTCCATTRASSASTHRPRISFGQQALAVKGARGDHRQAPDIEIVGDELHGAPPTKNSADAAKIKASGAQAASTGNWDDLRRRSRRRARPAWTRSSTPSTATAGRRWPPSARLAWSTCCGWPNGTERRHAGCRNALREPSANAFETAERLRARTAAGVGRTAGRGDRRGAHNRRRGGWRRRLEAMSFNLADAQWSSMMERCARR